jgi:hypothetical protein
MKKPTKPKQPKDKKPVVKTQTDPYCPPGTHWDKNLQRCVDDIG